MLSDDDDDGNNTPEEAVRNDLIRRRKPHRLIERKKQGSESKDSITAPPDPLPLNRRLSNHHDFLAVHIFLVDLEDMVVRKDWGSPNEMNPIAVIEKNLKRIKLILTGTDGPTTPTTLEGFSQYSSILFIQAPAEAAYPER